MICLDVETHCGAPGEWPLVVAMGFTSGDRVSIVERPRAGELLGRWLAAGETLVAHYAAFDMSALARTFPNLLVPIWDAYQDGRILCTLRGAQLRDIRETGDVLPKGYGLDALAARYGLPVPDKGDAWRLRYGELDGVPVESWPRPAVEYLAADVAVLFKLALEVTDEVDIERQSAHSWWLSRVAAYGFVTDRQRLQSKREALEAESARLRAECASMGIYRPDGTRDMKRLAEYAERAGVTARTPTGKVQVKLDTIAGIDDPALAAYAGTLSIEAHLNRLLPLLDADVVRCRYNLLASGRDGASGSDRAGAAAEGGNVQNLPRDGGWRETIVPRRGTVFGIADFAGLELASFAEAVSIFVGPGGALAAALNAGLDPHVLMAAQLMGCSDSAAIAAADGKLGADAKAQLKRYRQIAKVPNFGLIGGLGPAGFVAFARTGYKLILTIDRARELIAAWKNRWPEAVPYLRWAAALADSGEPLIVPYSGRVRGNVRYTQACNTPFQGMGADMAKLSGFRVQRECEIGSMRGSHLVLFCHDELVAEHPEHCAAEHAETMGAIMRDTAREWFQFVPCHAPPLLAARYSKKAEERRDAAGRLTVWDESK